MKLWVPIFTCLTTPGIPPFIMEFSLPITVALEPVEVVLVGDPIRVRIYLTLPNRVELESLAVSLLEPILEI